jgi:hypothetical protein
MHATLRRYRVSTVARGSTLFLNYIVALALWRTPTMEAELYSAFVSRFIILEMKYFIDALQKLKHLGQALFQKF